MKIKPFSLERYFAQHEFTAPYVLCASDCQSFSVGELMAMEPGSSENLRDLHLGYTESSGSLTLREEIAGLYSSIRNDEVLVHSGAEEAIFTFMNAVLNKGDHIIVHYPCYQSLVEIALSIGCDVTPWVSCREGGWELDPDTLAKQVKSTTKAVVINCPHNPTGYVMPEDRLHSLVDLSNKHGFIIFSDEVYRFLEHNENKRMEALCNMDDRAVSLGVMSKSFGLAGLRIGWIATRNRNVFKKMAVIKDYTTICNNAPGEFLAELALRNRDTIITRNLNIIKHNIVLLNNLFAEHATTFLWNPPQAGPIAFPSLTGDMDARDFCDDLLQQTGLLLLPGDVYGGEYRHHFRIGFGRKNLPECIDMFRDYLNHRGPQER